MECYFNAENKKLLLDMEQGIQKRGKKEKRVEGECDCLPSCTSIQYDAEISQADYDWKEVFQSYKSNTSDFPE